MQSKATHVVCFLVASLIHVTGSNGAVTCASVVLVCLLLASLLRAGTCYGPQRERNMCQVVACLLAKENNLIGVVLGSIYHWLFRLLLQLRSIAD